MMYKVFAGGTLVVAPMIVLALQNFAPHHQPVVQPAAAPAAIDIAPAAAAVTPPPVTPSAPQSFVAPPAGEPVADAGQPSMGLVHTSSAHPAVSPEQSEPAPDSL
ncbi:MULTISPECIES: hypothetical protein [Sphingobium]|jgi:hypothetical protein|nr:MULTISPECIES: hypothetical protein [Sphingobium]KMW29077.1 hypothetical protein BV87_16075 [Sphingobium yanoikuyae]